MDSYCLFGLGLGSFDLGAARFKARKSTGTNSTLKTFIHLTIQE